MRAELLGQLVGVQFDLEKAVAEVSRAVGAVPASALDQLRSLALLQRQIGAASPTALAALRSEVTGAVSATRAVAQESRAAVADAITADSLGLSGIAAASRQQVVATMAGMHRFDADLRFASAEDEGEYHRREAERRAYVDAQLASGTPQGNLNASAGAIGQMVDAKAHGAGDNPEFQQRWNELVTSTEKLRDEVRRSGGNTAEFDTRLREDLRRILKAKGLTDAQIDAQFAANPDPLEAAKAYVNEGDVRQIEAKQNTQGDAALSTRVATAAPAPPSDVANDSLGGAIADLKALSFPVAEHSATVDPAHGVVASYPAQTARERNFS